MLSAAFHIVVVPPDRAVVRFVKVPDWSPTDDCRLARSFAGQIGQTRGVEDEGKFRARTNEHGDERTQHAGGRERDSRDSDDERARDVLEDDAMCSSGEPHHFDERRDIPAETV